MLNMLLIDAENKNYNMHVISDANNFTRYRKKIWFKSHMAIKLLILKLRYDKLTHSNCSAVCHIKWHLACVMFILTYNLISLGIIM